MKIIDNKKVTVVSNILSADLATHNGVFHSDEVFSTALLILLSNQEEISICRTSCIPENTSAFVYDVGYGKYDHHQLGGNGERENGIKYSSCGLIWRDFGRELLQKLNIENIEDVWDAIDRKLIQTIDAVDNGQLESQTKYNLEVLNIPSLITLYNSNWDEEQNQDTYFLEAVEFAGKIFLKILEDVSSEYKAKKNVEEAIEKSENSIMILDQFMPWQEFVLQSDSPKAKELLFVIFPSNRGGFNIYSVPKELGSFESRKLFPEAWGGSEGETLKNVTNIETARFCHNNRFICCADNLEDAIKLAKIAVEKE